MINGVNHDKIPKLNYTFWVERRVSLAIMLIFNGDATMTVM